MQTSNASRSLRLFTPTGGGHAYCSLSSLSYGSIPLPPYAFATLCPVLTCCMSYQARLLCTPYLPSPGTNSYQLRRVRYRCRVQGSRPPYACLSTDAVTRYKYARRSFCTEIGHIARVSY
eukprot:2942996-Rhodomonas_salina.1